ncbi:MAG: UDP-N-acetylmuramoyl-tripeptide--D-alanyl-D-alanine ligase [Proteobacteria bacterium]|nr:UDP-N-acetylmuramoyl-tripeptide--D-alanyl-D-alanine ligase [Pseudomonadota bacterium]MBU1737050.1 UDP-N-acetylmuramoyl-tripeptide--D-alanyl-D-alanine ligase [Pseudomonadota bacterium]
MQKNTEQYGFGYGFNTSQDMAWTLAQVVAATGGSLESGDGGVVFRSISTDTRKLETGDLFVALSGENFDGEAFAEDAVRSGAAGLVLKRKPVRDLKVPLVLVPDTLKALGDLASYRRRQMKALKVIAITGSSGKTTVKEMTAAVFSKKSGVLKTLGNFNNLIGLPLSLLPVDSSHRIAILEMGMNQPGEIARMTEIAAPDIACINNVQNAHLQGLDNLDGVARAKGELFAGLGPEATMVVNLDDRIVAALAERYPQKKITFGLNRKAQVRATYIRHRGENGVSFTLVAGPEKVRVRMQCVGKHNVLNALAAGAMAWAAGVNLKEIAAGLAGFAPYDKRFQIEKIKGGIRLVNDTYNANPASMLAALETVKGLSRDNRSAVVIGDMLELGSESVAAHRFIGKTVARLSFDYLLTFGSFAKTLAEAAREDGMAEERIFSFASKEEIVACLQGFIRENKIGANDWLLVKGSRGLRMETVVSGLQEANG